MMSCTENPASHGDVASGGTKATSVSASKESHLWRAFTSEMGDNWGAPGGSPWGAIGFKVLRQMLRKVRPSRTRAPDALTPEPGRAPPAPA
jgi:hypothetical protein